MLMLLAWGPYFENHYYVKTVSRKYIHIALQKQAIIKVTYSKSLEVLMIPRLGICLLN